MNQVSNILHRATATRHNCITWPTHERVQSYMAGCDTDFYMMQGTQGIKDGWVREYAEIPANHTLLPKSENLDTLPKWLSYSFILSNHKMGQWQAAKQLSQMGGLPIIQYEHCWPQESWSQNMLDQYKSMTSDINVFISKQSLSKWGYEENESNIVIEHGVNSELFKPDPTNRQPSVLFQGNDVVNRSYILGFDIFQDKVINAKLPHMIVGNTNRVSTAAAGVVDLVEKINKNSIYANFARESPMPMSLLEAMSCGLAPVSVDTCMASELIEHNVNGLKSNDPKELQGFCTYLLEKPGEAERLGNAARDTILNRFSLGKFVDNWNGVFAAASKLVYKA